jgi:hypothetical protein
MGNWVFPWENAIFPWENVYKNNFFDKVNQVIALNNANY